MRLSRNFTLHELTFSETAQRHGISNLVPGELLDNVKLTAQLLQRIRDFLTQHAGREIPIRVSSGYRCLELNRLLRSSDSSHHVQGLAADWTAPAFGTPTRICQVLVPYVDELGIGQLINEYPDRGGWVHVSIRAPLRSINRIITIKGSGTFTGIIN